jgi:hypothetical protein
MNNRSNPSRRVYRRELRERLGYGDTWFGELQKRGRIPRGHRDPGGNREWWTDIEAEAIVRGLNQQAVA